MAMKTEGIVRYASLGAGAALVPGLLGMVPQLMDLVNKIPGVGYEIMGVTVGTIALGAVGIAAVEQLFFK